MGPSFSAKGVAFCFYGPPISRGMPNPWNPHAPPNFRDRLESNSSRTRECGGAIISRPQVSAFCVDDRGTDGDHRVTSSRTSSRTQGKGWEKTQTSHEPTSATGHSPGNSDAGRVLECPKTVLRRRAVLGPEFWIWLPIVFIFQANVLQ